MTIETEGRMLFNFLTAAEQLPKLLDGALEFFTNFQPIFAVEILVFFALIFLVSKILRDNDATKLMLV